MTPGVYKIENTLTGRCYVGSSVLVARRLKYHNTLLVKGKHWNAYLQAAWNKYGAQNFKFYKLLVCSNSLLLYYEQRAINIHQRGPGVYNLSLIAGRGGRPKGFITSPETRAKQSASKTPEEYRLAAIKGWETRRASGKPEKKRTAAQRAKQSVGIRKYLSNPANLAKVQKTGKKNFKKYWTKKRRKEQAEKNRTPEHKAKCAAGYTTEKRKAAAKKCWAKRAGYKTSKVTRKRQSKAALKRWIRERKQRKRKL